MILYYDRRQRITAPNEVENSISMYSPVFPFPVKRSRCSEKGSTLCHRKYKVPFSRAIRFGNRATVARHPTTGQQIFGPPEQTTSSRGNGLARLAFDFTPPLSSCPAVAGRSSNSKTLPWLHDERGDPRIKNLQLPFASLCLAARARRATTFVVTFAIVVPRGPMSRD